MAFFDVVAEATSEINLGTLLRKVMSEAMRMLDAERSTLFLNDEKTNELYSRLGEGLGTTEIRFPNSVGIAGAVFRTGETINIPHAYADLRFNPSFDKQTGFFYPLYSLYAGDEQIRQNHRRHAGPEQAGWTVHQGR